MRFLTRQDLAFPRRTRSSHKGDNGRVLVVAGSKDYAGAAYLASMAAFRTGVDQVVVAAPSKVAWLINTYSADIITKKLEGDCLAERTLLLSLRWRRTLMRCSWETAWD